MLLAPPIDHNHAPCLASVFTGVSLIRAGSDLMEQASINYTGRFAIELPDLRNSVDTTELRRLKAN